MSERHQSLGTALSVPFPREGIVLPQRSPLTVSVIGIDGSGKSTVTEAVAGQFGQDQSVARVGLPTYTLVEGERRDPYRRLLESVSRLRGLPGGIDIALNVLLQGRVIEPGLMRSLKPDLVVGSRDYVIDPSVYASFYSPVLARMPIDQRLGVMRRVTGLPFRKAIFFLSVPPEIAAVRIEKRLEDQKTVGYYQGDRRKIDRHEDLHGLRILRTEYDNALNAVARRTDSQIFEIDATREADEVIDSVRSIIGRFIQSPVPVQSPAFV